MLDNVRISVARVAEVMDSWIKDTHIICSYSRGHRIKLQKKSQIDTVYFQPKDSREIRMEGPQ